VLLFVGDDANNHNLLQEGRPFIMRLQQLTMSFTPRFRTNLLSPTQDVTIGASSIRQFPERDQD
jgi:hypothetical protein